MRMRIAVRPAGQATGKAVLTDAQKARLGPEGRIPVRLEVGGETFRTTLVRMHGEWCFVANARMRAAGFAPGRSHVVEIARDEEPRVVEPPPELAAGLARDPDARAAWEALSPSHRREYAEWIAEAKREETRARRVEETLAALRGSSRARRAPADALAHGTTTPRSGRLQGSSRDRDPRVSGSRSGA